MLTLGRGALVPLDLIIRQGATNRYKLRYLDADREPIDLTDWTARAQIRTAPGSDLWATLDVVLGADGSVEFEISPATTETPAWNKRTRGAWDVELVSPGGDVIALAAGAVLVEHDVTRS